MRSAENALRYKELQKCFEALQSTAKRCKSGLGDAKHIKCASKRFKSAAKALQERFKCAARVLQMRSALQERFKSAVKRS
jgi:hypothetical protein